MFLLNHPIVKVLPDKRVWQRGTSSPSPHAFYLWVLLGVAWVRVGRGAVSQ